MAGPLSSCGAPFAGQIRITPWNSPNAVPCASTVSWGRNESRSTLAIGDGAVAVPSGATRWTTALPLA